MISFIRLLYKNDAVRAAVVMFAVLFALPTYKAVAVDASILPQGVTQFLDDDGNPLSNGKVYFYVPTTLTFKTTWQNAAKSITNTNPVDLDAGGRAIIYGDGSYRQIVKDSLANTIYDAVTTAPLTAGSASLVGDGNLVSTVLPWSGLVAPAQYVFGYGQEIARATYPEFYTAITSTQTVGCTLGSPTITGLSDATQIIVGTAVELSCVAAGTTVLSKTLTTAVLSNSSSVSTTATAVFFPWGNGNGSTTFNVPDLRGYNLAGRDNMGGTASARLVNGNGLGRPLGIANFTYTATSPTNVTTQTFLSGTAATYTRPAGVTKIVVTMVAGGGGGGAVVTNAGSQGVDTTWVVSGGTNWTALAGTGGGAGAGAGGVGGTGGVDGTGTLIVRQAGGRGGAGSANNTAGVQPSSGLGGSTPFGVGAPSTAGTPFAPPPNSGAGGAGGGGNASTSSGSGGGGGEYVQFSIDAPAATYTYTIGTGGVAGAAGTIAGIAGAAGRIYVEEHYTTTPSTTSFTATTAGTLEQQRTINYVVKVTPDTSTSIATGVASLGGMTGVVTCGAGLLCTGNNIAVSNSGSVTSVAFSVPSSIFGITGSPITTNGTLGLTVTGTSGGIPYFSSSSALGSSAVLTANQLIVGGGAGTAPSTITLGTGLGISAGVLSIQGSTNRIPYFSGTNALTTSANLTYTAGAALVQLSSSVTLSPALDLTNTTNDDTAPYFTCHKTRAGAATIDNDRICNFLGYGYTGAVATPSGDISIYQDGPISGTRIPTKIYLNPSSRAGTSLDQWWEFDAAAHQGIHQYNSPALSACGATPNLRTGSSDAVGAFTEGVGGTGCVLTFANAYRLKPFCTVTPESFPAAWSYSVTTTALTIVTSASFFAEVTYTCYDSSNP